MIHLSAANSLKGEDPTWRSRCPSRALAKFDSTVRCRFPVRASLTLAAFGQAKLLQWLVARPEHVVNSGERRGALDSHPEASPPTRSWNSTNGGASHEVLPAVCRPCASDVPPGGRLVRVIHPPNGQGREVALPDRRGKVPIDVKKLAPTEAVAVPR